MDKFGYPYDPNDGREKLKQPDNVWRVARGGSFRSGAENVRCAYRGRSHPNHWASDVGFRVVSLGF